MIIGFFCTSKLDSLTFALPLTASIWVRASVGGKFHPSCIYQPQKNVYLNALSGNTFPQATFENEPVGTTAAKAGIPSTYTPSSS
ncbi:hypothetical protein I7I53_12209 [Histoplasma capsulatum var. duboisii H88]|uniref:Uncharacterized protein n=1 Tax=Ajellomyces capsulatus (strain H88) TaxID=544711 RepID=A0A8A1LUT9_AJEC8|nr:hypothetical protein I7I53_12209 [Histoplasma capsulatum var. duboisii H88]